MRNTIKALTRGILAGTGLLTLLPSQATAGLCDMNGCWEVGAEALWWKPCVCNFEYAIAAPQTESSTTPNSKTIYAVKPDYDWGFRVWIGADSSCDCYFINLAWTHLQATSTSNVNAPTGSRLTPLFSLVSNNFNDYTNALGRYKNDYDKVNLRAARYLYKGCDIDYYGYAGLRWVDIKQRRQIFATHTVVNTSYRDFERQTAEFDGVGLELGLGGRYHIGCGFNLVGNASVVTVLGHSRLHSELSLTDNGGAPSARTTASNLKFPSSTTCAPGIELRLGFSYMYECGCVELTGEIGYELDYYYGALSRPLAQSDTANTTALWSNVGFGGLYIGAGICF